jgi:hypothetical protein
VINNDGDLELPTKTKKKKPFKPEFNHYDFMPVRWKGMGHELSIRVHGNTWRIEWAKEVAAGKWTMEVVIDRRIVASCDYDDYREAGRSADIWFAGHGMNQLTVWADEVKARR